VSLKRLLRMLILAEAGLILVGIVASLLTEPLLPEPLRTYALAEWEGELTGHDVALLGVGIPLVCALVASLIGLWRDWRVARPMYLATTVTVILLAPAFGPYVDYGWGELCEEASAFVSGSIATLVYFSPLATLYAKRSTAALDRRA